MWETDPIGVTVTPDGTKVYVANYGSNNVSVINTTTTPYTVTSVPVGAYPWAFGQFIRVLTHPTITWNDPDNIVYGTPLSNTQLNATASVPGNFSYNPTPGTVLNSRFASNIEYCFRTN